MGDPVLEFIHSFVFDEMYFSMFPLRICLVHVLDGRYGTPLGIKPLLYFTFRLNGAIDIAVTSLVALLTVPNIKKNVNMRLSS